ncbi:DUF5994 family protein [Mycobacterium sp. NPDC003449]
MSAPTLSLGVAQTHRSTPDNLRLRLKPAHRSCGFVQGAWWPRTDRLSTELPQLLAALTPLLGTVDRVVYDGSNWAQASLRMEFRGHSVILTEADASTNTLSVIGGGFGALVLLVVPPRTDPALAYTAVMSASAPEDVSTPDQLLGIGPREARDRRLAVLAHQRWESEGGALRLVDRERG